MKNVLPQSLFKPNNVDADGSRYIFPERGGSLSAECSADSICGVPFTEGMWLVMDLTNDADFACAFTWVFFEKGEERNIGFKMGLLPHLRTRAAIPASALDGSILFLPRTPGKLKTVTQGRPIKTDRLSRLAVTVPSAPGCVPIVIHDIYITDAEPDYPVETMPMVDLFGQKVCSDWKGKTHSETELCEFLRSEAEKSVSRRPPGRSRYGGWTKKRFEEPTGYFTVRHDGRRFWLADPEGYAFFSTGLDCVSVDGDCNLKGIRQLATGLPPQGSIGWSDRNSDMFSWHKANLYRAFGDSWYEKWAKITRRRLTEWGFNTIACWSDMNYIKRDDRPYVFIFGRYPQTEHNIFRDFPDVFSEEFASSADQYARRIIPFKDDKNLIGYFLSNEPEWAFVDRLNIAAVMLESDYPFKSKLRLAQFLKERYGTVDNLNTVWGTKYSGFGDIMQPVVTASLSAGAQSDLLDFSAEMIREYIRVPSLAVRGYDPNHLNLGIRYAWLSSSLLVSGSEYFDVFSFNCYSMDPTDSMENIRRTLRSAGGSTGAAGKPLMIGEFHFGALDRGLDATGIRGVSSQEERGRAFRYYINAAAAHPCCVGAHYFILNDQGYLGRFDGENYQIGVVDVCNRPYDEFVSGIITANDELYEVAEGTLPRTAEKAHEIAAVFY